MKPSGDSTRFDEIVAIIPAAGKGSRYGMPKAEAKINGRTFLELVTETLHTAGIDRIITVTGIDTPDMLASIRVGVTRAKEEASAGIPIGGYLIFPVDHPLVQPETVISLCNCFRSHPETVIIPCYIGALSSLGVAKSVCHNMRHNRKSGHPIIIPASLDLDRQVTRGLSQIIHASRFPIVHIETHDANVIRNLNTPGDLGS
ncbi:MAG: NTP transferase domain-containing protein [Candidatus Cloacimonetes bacterium]|nr:NTP transferase domain-containing protein [Candidatus Cloacimonadota bacterium]